MWLDLDMHYLRISAITVKILNQFRMQIEFVVERARKVHDRESIWEYGATPPGNRRVSRKVHPKGIPRSWRTSRWNELSLVSRVSRDVSTLRPGRVLVTRWNRGQRRWIASKTIRMDVKLQRSVIWFTETIYFRYVLWYFFYISTQKMSKSVVINMICL